MNFNPPKWTGPHPSVGNRWPHGVNRFDPVVLGGETPEFGPPDAGKKHHPFLDRSRSLDPARKPPSGQEQAGKALQQSGRGVNIPARASGDRAVVTDDGPISLRVRSRSASRSGSADGPAGNIFKGTGAQTLCRTTIGSAEGPFGRGSGNVICSPCVVTFARTGRGIPCGSGFLRSRRTDLGHRTYRGDPNGPRVQGKKPAARTPWATAKHDGADFQTARCAGFLQHHLGFR